MKWITFVSGSIFVIMISGNLFGAMVYQQKSEEKRQFNNNKESAELCEKPGYRERERQKKTTIWLGDFQDKEKDEIFSFIDNLPEFCSLPARILKTDLEGDGDPDYILWGLFIRDPQPYHYSYIYAVLSKHKGKFKFNTISVSLEWMQSDESRLVALDLDGDGLKEIIVGWEDDRDYDPENPVDDKYRNIIYKNEGGSFREVYERKTFDYLKIIDIDGNGIPEVLEGVHEFEKEISIPDSRWLWVNVYNLGMIRLEKTNQRYLKFYEEKKKEYQALIKEAQEKEAELHKTGKLCPDCYSIYLLLEETMNAYIKRIDAMIQSDSKRK